VHVTVVSDSHLSERTPEASANWDAVVDHVNAVRPDIVVHAGDISADGAELPDDLAFAHARLGRIGVSLLVVPGNHDVGDIPMRDTGTEGSPAEGAGHGVDVDGERVARFRAVFGADRFSVVAGRWRLVGINAQLLGGTAGPDDAGGPGVERDAADQWAWLERELGGLGPDDPVALVSHRPLLPVPGDLDEARHCVPPAARERLVSLLGDAGPRLVVSGHVHQALRHARSGLDNVWAPTTWAVLPDTLQPTVGRKMPGLVELTLHDDGRVDVTTRAPDGMRQLVLGDDVDDPYGIV
jgi:3',5'-cyclic AMP phosphodiesterase CpdA